MLGTTDLERMAVLKESIRWTGWKIPLNHPIILQQPKETILFKSSMFFKKLTGTLATIVQTIVEYIVFSD